MGVICARGTTSPTGWGGTISAWGSERSRPLPVAGGGTAPRLPAYLEALERGARPERELEELGQDVRRRERLMLGLRLDEPIALERIADVVDPVALGRLEQLGLLVRPSGEDGGDALALTKRGRLLGGGVTAELLN